MDKQILLVLLHYLKNNTYEHTYYIDTSENQEIQVKAIGGNDAVKYTNLTITFNGIQHPPYTNSDSSYTTTNNIKMAKNDNTVGWLSLNSGNKPAIRWYNDKILNFIPIPEPKNECAAHYGTVSPSDRSDSGIVAAQYICPESKPVCNNYEFNVKWGECAEGSIPT